MPLWLGREGVPRRLPIANGRRFGCTRCGHCCLEPGFVYLSESELSAIASALGLEAAAFRDRYGVKWMEEADRWAIDASDGTGCPLLDRGSCRVHAVKPAQCRSFPFWPELIGDARAWAETKRYCPGLDTGPLHSEAQILELSAAAGA